MSQVRLLGQNHHNVESSQGKENTGLLAWVKSLFSNNKEIVSKNPSFRGRKEGDSQQGRPRSESLTKKVLIDNAKRRSKSVDNIDQSNVTRERSESEVMIEQTAIKGVKFVNTPIVTPENSPRPQLETCQKNVNCKEIFKISGKELDLFMQAATPTFYFNLFIPEVSGTFKWVLATDAFVLTGIVESSFKVFIGLPLGKKPTKIDILTFTVNGFVTLLEASLLGTIAGEFVKNNIEEWREIEYLQKWVLIIDKKPYFLDVFGTIGFLLFKTNQIIINQLLSRCFNYKEKNLFLRAEEIDTQNPRLRFAQGSYNFIITFAMLAAILEHLKINEYEEVANNPDIQLLLLVLSYTLQQGMSLFNMPNLRQYLLLPYTTEPSNRKLIINCLTGNEKVDDDEDLELRSAKKQLILSTGLRGVGHVAVSATMFLLGKAWCWIDDEHCKNNGLTENLLWLTNVYGITMFAKTLWNYRGSIIAAASNCYGTLFHSKQSQYEAIEERPIKKGGVVFYYS